MHTDKNHYTQWWIFGPESQIFLTIGTLSLSFSPFYRVLGPPWSINDWLFVFFLFHFLFFFRFGSFSILFFFFLCQMTLWRRWRMMRKRRKRMKKNKEIRSKCSYFVLPFSLPTLSQCAKLYYQGGVARSCCFGWFSCNPLSRNTSVQILYFGLWTLGEHQGNLCFEIILFFS